jgi:hypothetical protein
MAARSNNERAEDHVHENVTPEIYRQYLFLPFPLRTLSGAFGLTA